MSTNTDLGMVTISAIIGRSMITSSPKPLAWSEALLVIRIGSHSQWL